MKKNLIIFFVVCTSIFSLIGCELTTDVPKLKPTPTANHLLINEVFTLPSTHQGAYSWIEVYNPTNANIESFSVLNDSVPRDTSGNVIDTTMRIITLKALYVKIKSDVYFENPFSQFEPPTYGGFREVYIPISTVVNSLIFSPEPFFSLGDSVFNAGGFAVYVNDPNKMLEHTDVGGPGTLNKPLMYAFDSLVKLSGSRGIQTNDKTFPIFSLFQLPKTSEIAIVERTATIVRRLVGGFGISFFSIDSVYNISEEVIDVVRYGNYVLPVGGTVEPKNKSIGFIPEFFSLARYAGGYVSAIPNTKNDFYFESQPIPMWHNSKRRP